MMNIIVNHNNIVIFSAELLPIIKILPCDVISNLTSGGGVYEN